MEEAQKAFMANPLIWFMGSLFLVLLGNLFMHWLGNKRLSHEFNKKMNISTESRLWELEKNKLSVADHNSSVRKVYKRVEEAEKDITTMKIDIGVTKIGVEYIQKAVDKIANGGH